MLGHHRTAPGEHHAHVRSRCAARARCRTTAASAVQRAFLRRVRPAAPNLRCEVSCEQRDIVPPFAQRRQIDFERAQAENTSRAETRLLRLSFASLLSWPRSREIETAAAHRRRLATLRHGRAPAAASIAAAGGISATSSMNSVPPFACSNKTGACAAASHRCAQLAKQLGFRRSSGSSAATLTVTNGPCRRLLLRWIAAAASSLPTPLSPCSRTAASEFAASAMFLNTFCIAGDRPSMPSSASVRRSLVARQVDSQCPFDHGANLGQIERLHHIFKRAFAHRIDRGRQIAKRGDHDDRRAVQVPGKRFHRRQPIHARQTHVENQNIRPVARRPDAIPSSAERGHIHCVPHAPRQAATGPRRSTVRHQQLEFWTPTRTYFSSKEGRRETASFRFLVPKRSIRHVPRQHLSPPPAPARRLRPCLETNGSNSEPATESASARHQNR